MRELQCGLATRDSMKYIEKTYPRFHAWWHGLDLPGDSIVSTNGGGSSEETAKAIGSSRIAGHNRWGKPLWNAERLKVAEKLWGEGNIWPLSGKNYLYYLASLGLNPSMTILEIGAGLGTFGQMIVENYGAYYTGLEDSEKLRSDGNIRASKKGLTEKIQLIDVDREHFEYRQRRVDSIIMREFFYTIENKKPFIENMGQCLKDSGQILLIDYFMDPNALDNGAINKWKKREPIVPVPITINVLMDMLQENGFYVNVCEDISEIYFASIYSSFFQFS